MPPAYVKPYVKRQRVDPSVSVGKLRCSKTQHNLCRTLTWNALSDLHDGIKPREGVDLPAPLGQVLLHSECG